MASWDTVFLCCIRMLSNLPKFGVVQLPGYLNSNYIAMPEGVMGTHAGAIEANLKTLPLITDKILVIIRDIRQSVVSKVAYSEYLRYSGNISALLQYQYPNGFFHWTIDKKIDWQIDNYYVPADIEWISGWLKAETDPDFSCEIHFSKFEDLAHDPKKFFPFRIWGHYTEDAYEIISEQILRKISEIEEQS